MAETGNRAAVRITRDERLAQMEAIVARYETSLLRYATRIVCDGHHAQDVVQNAFIKLFKNWKNDSVPSPRLKSWLYRTTHNEAVDLIRRESRRSKLHEQHRDDRAVGWPGREAAGHKVREKVEMVLEHIHRLSAGEQQVLLLRLEEGMSYKEIAEVTGRTQGNVGCVLHGAVKKLAAKLHQPEVTSRGSTRGSRTLNTEQGTER